jgi:hypothetical protein
MKGNSYVAARARGGGKAAGDKTGIMEAFDARDLERL